MIRHAVLIDFLPSATQADIDAFHTACSALPDTVGGVRGFSCGPSINDDPSAQNRDFVVVADFDDLDAYRAYATHDAHVQVITEYLRPILKDRYAIQFELPD